MSTLARPTWHGPVPYGGKPPPMPAGWNPNAVPNWNKGFWQPNPYYNPNAAQNSTAQPWMPAQGWQQQQQPGANFNPYKRVVKPPSAEYLATSLSDNPLGLTNMIPRDELYGKDQENSAAEHTPWLWNPTRLEEDDEQEAIITAVYRDQEGHRIGRESRGPAPTRHSSASDRPRDSPLDTRSRDTSQQRHYSEPVVSPPQQGVSRNRYNSEPPPDTSLDRRHSIDRPSSSSHRSGRSKSRDPNRPSSFQYGPSPPNSAPPTTSFPSVPTRANSMPVQPQPREDFTSDIPLRPTFSPNIIRTPEHYSNSPKRSHSVSSVGSSSTSVRPIQAHGSLDSMMSSHMGHLTMEEARRATEISTHNVSGADVFVDEPSSMLSPLMMNTPKPLANRPLGRNHSAPTSTLDVIPETSPIPPSQPPPQHLSSSRHVSPMSSRHVSPLSSAHEAHVTPPNSASSTRHMHRQSEYYSSASASASASTSPTKPSPRRKRRKGFWNRRGDHLTSTGKIVYAPHDRAYPEELRGYPDNKEGYMDEFGIFIGYLNSRHELEESLPRHGRPPSKPYESFVVYED